jgi:hypothetical protein
MVLPSTQLVTGSNLTNPSPQNLRCAIYCRVSTDESLAMEFNSIDAQREAAQA